MPTPPCATMRPTATARQTRSNICGGGLRRSSDSRKPKEVEPMTRSAWFGDLSVLGQLPPGPAAAKLREVGEDEAAARLEEVPRAGMFAPSGRWWTFQDRPW